MTGNRRLHRYHKFAVLLVETAPKSLRHSCRSELTRQGISLEVLPNAKTNAKADANFLWIGIPACRHADGTISSSGVPDVWRMASEDSDEFWSGFSSVHRLHNLRDLHKPFSGQVVTAGDQLHAVSELLEVLPLCC